MQVSRHDGRLQGQNIEQLCSVGAPEVGGAQVIENAQRHLARSHRVEEFLGQRDMPPDHRSEVLFGLPDRHDCAVERVQQPLALIVHIACHKVVGEA